MTISEARLATMLSTDSWLTAPEAKSMGLATTVGRKIPATVADLLIAYANNIIAGFP